jgi:hypothetical protein
MACLVLSAAWWTRRSMTAGYSALSRYSPEHWTRAQEALGRFDAESVSPNPSIHALVAHAGAFEGNMHELKMRMPNDLVDEGRVDRYIHRVSRDCRDEMHRVRKDEGKPPAFPGLSDDAFDAIQGLKPYLEKLLKCD